MWTQIYFSNAPCPVGKQGHIWWTQFYWSDAPYTVGEQGHIWWKQFSCRIFIHSRRTGKYLVSTIILVRCSIYSRWIGLILWTQIYFSDAPCLVGKQGHILWTQFYFSYAPYTVGWTAEILSNPNILNTPISWLYMSRRKKWVIAQPYSFMFSLCARSWKFDVIRWENG